MTDIQLPSSINGGLSQATRIEQSRAVEEVRAAVIVAQQVPRDVDRALVEMRRSCAHPGLASRAFYSFPRAGETIAGPSVHLARELARIWGNVQYNIQELARDDAAGLSEMQAYAWDLQTNTRSAATFIVPHARDTKGGRRQLRDLRDIYENNANNGARRLRECIFAVLPPWFTEEAKEICHRTISAVTGEDLQRKIGQAIAAYDRRGVSLDQLERKVGRPRADWTGAEYAQLDVLFGSIRRNEVSIEEAFPPARITTADIITPPAVAAQVQALADEPAADWPAVATPDAGTEGGAR